MRCSNSDQMGQGCAVCDGKYTEMSIHDDFEGMVTCCKCGFRTCRYELPEIILDLHITKGASMKAMDLLAVQINLLEDILNRFENFQMPEVPLEEKDVYYKCIVANMLADYKAIQSKNRF